MGPRRRSALVGACAVVLLGLGGCGSSGAPQAGPTSRASSHVPGTRPSVPGATTTSPTGVEASTSVALTDQESGDFVRGLGTDRLLILEVGIHGVGKAWNTQRATVTREGDTTVVRYDGPGQLDAQAHLGLSSIADLPVDPHRVHLQVEASMTSTGLGHADVWIDHRHFTVVADEPPHTADPVVAAVVDAFTAEDWSALYDLSARLPGMSRAEFVKTFGGNSTVTSLDITGDTVYGVANGIAFADAPAHVVAALPGRHLDRDVAVELVYQSGDWRFSRIARSVRAD
jgi:hypothetical protein